METMIVLTSLMKSTALVIVKVSLSARTDSVFLVPSFVMEIMTVKMVVMKKIVLKIRVSHAKKEIQDVFYQLAPDHVPMTPTVKYLKTKPTAVSVSR